MSNHLHQDYVRSSLFGFQDALVSTSGVIVGIATGTSDRRIIILAALVAVSVEAISMAAGQYLSERAVHHMGEKEAHTDNELIGALIMFVSYIIGGAIPVIPIFFLPAPLIGIASIIFTFFGLFVLGYVTGRIVKRNTLRSAFEMLLIGGLAAMIGATVGYFLKI